MIRTYKIILTPVSEAATPVETTRRLRPRRLQLDAALLQRQTRCRRVVSRQHAGYALENAIKAWENNARDNQATSQKPGASVRRT